MSIDMALWRSGLLKVIQPTAPSRSAITRLVLLNTGPSSLFAYLESASLAAHGQPVLVLKILQAHVVARIVAITLGVDLVQFVRGLVEEREEILEQVARVDVGRAILELDVANGAPPEHLG